MHACVAQTPSPSGRYNHPTTLESLWPPRLKNLAPKSVITRMGQGFLQRAAFPLQFEFLFDFPGPLSEMNNEPEALNGVERALMAVEMGASGLTGRAGRSPEA